MQKPPPLQVWVLCLSANIRRRQHLHLRRIRRNSDRVIPSLNIPTKRVRMSWFVSLRGS